ncbi:ion transporter, partial [Vibrio parahaemolyticus]|uniref:ion transporter n=1 Tax=Vibrio parahaemolyticus TaxID=670 RepID=UPI001EEA6A7C
MSRQSLKHHLSVIIFGTHTPAGRAFDIGLIVAILTSLLVLLLESLPSIRAQWASELKYLEYGFTALFTLEYLLRLYCSPKPAAYARSFYGVVDLLAILPTYLAFLVPSAAFMG